MAFFLNFDVWHSWELKGCKALEVGSYLTTQTISVLGNKTYKVFFAGSQVNKWVKKHEHDQHTRTSPFLYFAEENLQKSHDEAGTQLQFGRTKVC